VLLVDADFRIRQANPTATPVFGDIPDLIGRDFDEVIHRLWPKESADELVRQFRRTLETGESYGEAEYSSRRVDREGTEYYEWRINRIPLPDGRFGVVCYFRDVSAQVRVREEIERSEERFRAFVTATSDVIYQISPDWSEMRQLVGRDFIADTTDPSRSWLDRYIHPYDHAMVLKAIAKAIRNRTMFELEHRVIRVDGSLGWTYSRAVPRLSAEGEVIEWFGTARDVSERKFAEEEIARLTAESEQQRRLYEAIVSSTPDFVVYL
jgi:PAS domain S-box-containing protein